MVAVLGRVKVIEHGQPEDGEDHKHESRTCGQRPGPGNRFGHPGQNKQLEGQEGGTDRRPDGQWDHRHQQRRHPITVTRRLGGEVDVRSVAPITPS